MPAHLAPMLATAGRLPAEEVDGDWAYEIKWDGVRVLSYLRAGSVHLESRNLRDITARYPELHGLAVAAGCDAVLDGEVVAFDHEGRPSFQTLQQRMHLANSADVARRVSDVPVIYLIFDVLWVDGTTTMGLEFRDRRQVLEQLDLSGPSWRVPASQPGGGAELLSASVAQGLEGVIAKRLDSTYEPGRRSRSWVKVKNVGRQEVVIGGWIPGEGGRSGRIGALLIGVHDNLGLRFAGKVGTGFTDRMLDELANRFAPLQRDSSPFADSVPWRGAIWLEPTLVADVEFTEWTRDGTLRHPSFKGLRDDRAAADVVREPSP